jgi:hypothetical protein
MSGWTVVDTATNKSVPVGGTQSSGTPGGAGVAYTTPAPSSVDPVGKLRVSQPQSLIDTDFEYGPQPTKWESIALQNNRATAYYIPQSPLTVTSITGLGTSGTPLTITGTFSIAAGSIIYIQNATDSNANGWGFTASGGTNTMTVVMSTTSAAGEKFNTAGTYVYLGYFYSGSGFRLATTTAFTTSGSSSVDVTTATPHGLNIGSLIYVVGTTSSGTSINGPQIVNNVGAPTVFSFQNVNGAVAASAITNSIGQTNVYARSAGFVESRPYDGGVAFSASSVGVSQQLIRQTRRYFRYQSGKGIQFSTGTSLCPTLFVTSITSSGTTATVTTRFAHNLSVGCVVRVQNCSPGGYNGNYTVATVPTPTTFTYTLISSVSNVQATGFPMRVSPVNWYGASNRAGMFDQQNGMFFEYDGQQLYAVYRTSVQQLNGTVTVTNGSGTVTGVGTQFGTQLIPGDFIVIRGQTYRVITIPSNTSLSISPEYRGTTITSPSYALVSKTVDIRIPQSQWNLDKCNGTGPSGYNIDLTRMQMLYMDYSWYGAGVIRWGVRATNGQVIYCHQQQNNNQQFEAYLRSGNMPAHYESNGIVGYTALDYPFNASIYYGTIYNDNLSAAITAQSTTIPVNNSTVFNPRGGVGQFTAGGEYFYYGGVVGNNLVNCIRGIVGTPRSYVSGAGVAPNSLALVSTDQFNPNGGTANITDPAGGNAQRFTYVGIYKNSIYGIGTGNFLSVPSSGVIGIEFVAPDTAAPLAHWGSSVIMDGLFDDDKSLVFNYGTTSTISLNAGTTVPIMAIRVAPTADNGTTGLLGIKETINRMQLQLNDMAVVSSGTILVNLVLNGFCTGFSGSFTSIATGNQVSSSLAQVAVNTSNTATITGGESVTALYSNGVNTLDLGQVRDLGNSILGGGTANTVPTAQANVYPDGPDILYVVATNTTGSAVTMLARINWKEAQA